MCECRWMFAVFSWQLKHPSGRPLKRCSFSQRLGWSYIMFLFKSWCHFFLIHAFCSNNFTNLFLPHLPNFPCLLFSLKELELYKEEFMSKPALLAVNKMDLPDAENKLSELKEQLQNPKGELYLLQKQFNSESFAFTSASEQHWHIVLFLNPDSSYPPHTHKKKSKTFLISLLLQNLDLKFMTRWWDIEWGTCIKH